MSKFLDRLARCDETGDYGPVIMTGMNARFEAEKGHYCECEHPILTGYDLMCGDCLLENQGQIDKRMRRSREPHAFEPMPKLPIMCNVCTGWEDDPRHKDASHD